MRLTHLLPAVLVLAFAAAPAVADSMTIGGVKLDFEDPALAPRDAVQKNIAAALISAYDSGNPDRVRQLTHPASLACQADGAGKGFYDDYYKRRAAKTIPPDAKVIFVPGNTDISKAFIGGGYLSLPVQPDFILGISYKSDQHDAAGNVTKTFSGTIIDMLAMSDGRLMLLVNCLTEKGLEKYRAMQAGQQTPAK